MDSVPNLTFLSIFGPTLDSNSAKAVRAHTTKANFARRRKRLVEEYTNKKERATNVQPLRVGEISRALDRRTQPIDNQIPFFIHLRVNPRLNHKDALLINHLMQAMGRLHSITNLPESEATSSMIKSDWARFLSDPIMIDVSLYWARLVYAGRLQQHANKYILEAHKGRALRSVRERLGDKSNGLSNSLIAAVVILTVLDQVAGNIEAWKIHISGLLQIIKMRCQTPSQPHTYWITHAIPRTMLQGLFLFTRHDEKLLSTIEKTGVFEAMFSGPSKRAAYLILANAEQLATLAHTYEKYKPIPAREQMRLRRIIKSLDTAMQMNSMGYAREAFLTAKALSIKIFVEMVLHYTCGAEEDFQNTAVVLMKVLQEPDQELCSSLALCSSLESVFWQTMMGAMAAPNAAIESFYMSRLEKISAALALASCRDAEVVLQRFYWVPSIFGAPCHRILNKILDFQGSVVV